MDPISIQQFKDDAYCAEFAKTKEDLWTTTKKLKTFLGKAKDFDAILYVGGFGRRISIQILLIGKPADDLFAASNV